MHRQWGDNVQKIFDVISLMGGKMGSLDGTSLDGTTLAKPFLSGRQCNPNVVQTLLGDRNFVRHL